MFKRGKRRPIEDVRIMAKLFPAADAAALADGVTDAGAEYLLAAALDLEDGSGRRAFEAIGADPDDFPAAVRAQHADALRGVGVGPMADDALDRHLPQGEPNPDAIKGPIKSSPSAHAMFRAVVKKVRRERSQLYGAYFVLVACEAERGTTIRAIRHMGIDPSALAAAARTEIDELNSDGR